MQLFLGVDVGSVSTNIVLINQQNQVVASKYLRTRGRPIEVVQEGLRSLKKDFQDQKIEIIAVGATGSARKLTGVILGADTVKNEITAHAVAASHLVRDVHTVLEIGGQDSKIIILRDGVVVDFAMNTVCAAGTGSFLDHQAERLGIDITEFSLIATQSKHPVRIAGRCSVFAESDMIHKQQTGHALPDIAAGLCDALVRNYLNNVGKGKEIKAPIVFQGGVAANQGIKMAFEKFLGEEIYVPKYFDVMGAIGAALLAKNTLSADHQTSFRGFEISDFQYEATSFNCEACPNLCEIVNIYSDGELLARWGSRCGKWDNLNIDTCQSQT